MTTIGPPCWRSVSTSTTTKPIASTQLSATSRPNSSSVSTPPQFKEFRCPSNRQHLTNYVRRRNCVWADMGYRRLQTALYYALIWTVGAYKENRVLRVGICRGRRQANH